MLAGRQNGRVEAFEAAGHCRIWSRRLLAAEETRPCWRRRAAWRGRGKNSCLVLQALGVPLGGGFSASALFSNPDSNCESVIPSGSLVPVPHAS